MRLNGKSVLITGGTGGMGGILAKVFSGEGARVVITHRDSYKRGRFPKRLEERLIPLEADLTSEKSVSALFRNAILRVRRVDILVNAAGGYLPSKSFVETTLREWDGLMDLNLKSVFLCARAFLAQKGIQKYGRIFNVSARSAFQPDAGKVPYSVSKAAVASLTTALAEEVKGTGITVNAFAPAILKTEANIRSMPGADTSGWVDPADIAEQMIALSSESGGSVNGAVIPVYGGA